MSEIDDAIDKKKEENQEKKEEVKDQKDGQITELTDTLKRLQAEFENYKRRTEKECQNTIKMASRDIIVKLLPLLDNFELALSHADDDDTKKGFELIFSQLFDILKEQGLEKTRAEGEKFDPYTMEAVMQERSDKGENIVLEELQSGYRLKDQVIRHSKVKVSK